ncbi:HU family DNA-binding protein [uncultured Thiodictyon sp.]|uniref:HU family DNA-binding protein n=1 Tax=uncultured Thiodictyon sp. TaxID=1846217 RepID=UPI0025EA89D6|nr:HU family DNA-binding protein [uncultured Thiodictyon sp.]
MPTAKPATLLGHTEIVAHLAQSFELPRSAVRDVLDGLTETLSYTLAHGGRARIAGLGIFEAPVRPARQGRGLDGQPYTVPARRRVTLRPDRSLSRAVAEPAVGAAPSRDEATPMHEARALTPGQIEALADYRGQEIPS